MGSPMCHQNHHRFIFMVNISCLCVGGGSGSRGTIVETVETIETFIGIMRYLNEFPKIISYYLMSE